MSTYYRRLVIRNKRDSNGNYSLSTGTAGSSSYWHRGSVQLQRWLGRYPSTSSSSTLTTSSSLTMSDGVTCKGFEPQNYLRDRCKKCFRLKSKHDEPNNNHHSSSSTSSSAGTQTNSQNGRLRRPVSVSSAIGPPDISPSNNATSVLPKKERRRSWRDRTNPDEGPDNEMPDTSDTTSVASFKSAISKGLSSAKSVESLNDTKSMVTAISGDSFGNEEDRALTPTESDYTGDGNTKLKVQLLEEEIMKLKEERRRFAQTPLANGKDSSIVEQLQQRLIDSESLIQDYRDENTVLKCELRDIQQPASQNIEQKLKTTEGLCDELMVENENLKSDVRELQHEIEEMQDQYREEEIEEFRDLQRELELNAKNCRVLQFKLRKAERQRDQVDTEKDNLLIKLKEISNGGDPMIVDYSKLKELESELRIAKEVSVRLHNELETAEEKRCKLEDEVFYFKEKCRELSTQNKWREARKSDSFKRQNHEIFDRNATASELAKELRDVLERETDLREQLKFTEDDLKRNRNKLNEVENENEELMQKLVKLSESIGRTSGSIRKAPMTRSASEGYGALQLETELEQMTTKHKELERKNVSLTKKMLELEIELAKKLTDKPDSGFQLNAELEKDLGRLMTTIHDLEKKNTELQMQLKRHDTQSTTLRVTTAPSSPIMGSGKEKALQVELRTEQDKRKELETEIQEYKSLMAKSDNQKLIAMATKVELLQNQLLLANDRCTSLHKKILKDVKEEGAHYADTLKKRCETLEKQLSEMEAVKTFKENSAKDQPTMDEIEQCCAVLASIEAQTTRLSKHMEKLDPAGQKDQRRRSLSTENTASIVAELATIQSELSNVKQLFKNLKIDPEAIKLHRNNLNFVMNSSGCPNCSEKEKDVDLLKEEVLFYKKKNKELTNQVLQTEDRWSREIEKQTHSLKTQIHGLDSKLTEVEEKYDEQHQMLNSTTNQLNEKQRVLNEEREKNQKLQSEMESRLKELQQIEKVQHGFREYEIKYKKLEQLFDQEKDKYDQEKNKMKSDTALLKKRTDEAVADLEKLRNSHQKREILWNDERQRLQREMDELKRGGAVNSKSTEIPVHLLNHKTLKGSADGISELQCKVQALTKRNEQLESQFVDLRISKEEIESELMRKKISFEREKDSILHKLRQDDKVKVVEIDALQQKFASRMSIMENTNKSLHSQLVQARRERDLHRESVSSYEKKMEAEQKMVRDLSKAVQDASGKCHSIEKRTQELEAEVHRLTVELSLSKDAHKADKKLWKIEKSHFNKSSPPSSSESGEENKNRIIEDALKAAESVQKQYAEYQQLYTTEVNRLNSKMKELQNEMSHKQFETDKMFKGLHEQIKVLEIDQKNLIQAKEMQTNAREVLQADQERLLQIVQQSEIQKLTRKYRIAAVVDQMNMLPERIRINDNERVLNSIAQQLSVICDEECQNAFTSSDIGSDLDSSVDSKLFMRSTSHHSSLAPKQNNFSSYSLATPSHRSYSTESSSTWDGRLNAYDNTARRSPQRITNYPDPPPSFLLSKDRVPEYDKDGRLHYIPKSIARSSSYDRYGQSLADPPSTMSASSAQIQTRSTGTWTEDGDASIASRTGSVGTNILYKIRRDELSKGTAPSVRNIAKAFESMDPRTLKRGLFSIRKSRSVDTNDQAKSKHNAMDGKMLRPISVLNRNTTSMSQIELGRDRPGLHNAPPIGPSIESVTLPRGGRNPFKNMGAKLVDRVRRSLSRTRKPSEEPRNDDRSDVLDDPQDSSQMLPPVPTSPPPAIPNHSDEKNTKPKGVEPTPVKAKKIVVKKKTSVSAKEGQK